MKKYVFSLIFLLGCSGFCYGQYGANDSSKPAYQQYDKNVQQNQQQVQQQMMDSTMMGPMNEGSHLSDQEQAFASQLSPLHKTMFCRHFSVAQRIEAMALASYQKDGDSQITPLSPDESVEIVMKNARGTQTPSPSPAQTQNQSDTFYNGSSGSSSTNNSSNGNSCPPCRGY